jgi:hypothetical protein
MVLISIHPFAFRKVLLAVLLLGLSSAFCFADSLFMTRHFAPSHHRAGSVKLLGSSQENTPPGPLAPRSWNSNSAIFDGAFPIISSRLGLSDRFCEVDNHLGLPPGEFASRTPFDLPVALTSTELCGAFYARIGR